MMNPFELLKNPAALQAQLAGFQEKLAALRVTGSSGGGMVRVTMNGKMEVVDLFIAPEALGAGSDGKPDLPFLSDLVKAAFRDAQARVQVAMQAGLGDLAQGN